MKKFIVLFFVYVLCAQGLSPVEKRRMQTLLL